jgi:thiosulfate/3-mercaptopyruvate sulfurtransferase
MYRFCLSYASRIMVIVSLLLLNQHVIAASKVTSSWLDLHLNDANLVLVDMDDDLQYQRFHLPGAVHLPYAAINYTNQHGVSYSVGREQLIKILGLLGANSDSHIVIYDDLGGLNASRLYWELEHLGHQRLALLDGGLVKWILEGRKVTNTPAQPGSTMYQPAEHEGITNLATLSEISRLPADAVLLDVRTQEEYAGDPRQPLSGHIPGARWWPWDNTVDFANDFRLKPAKVLKRQLQALGVSVTDAPIYLYCNSGHRASQTYFALRQLGFSKVIIYDGSMAEYSQHKELPLKTGMAP